MTQRSDAGEAQTHYPSILSQAPLGSVCVCARASDCVLNNLAD